MAGDWERQTGNEATRREGRCLVQTELWRTGAPACNGAQNPLLAQRTQGHRPQEYTRIAKSHTHAVEKYGPDQRRHSYVLSHPFTKCSQNTYHVPGSVWALVLVSNPHSI